MNIDSAGKLSQVLQGIVTALVDDEQHIDIRTITEEDRITLRVEVCPTDAGKVIGKMGRTARSIRTIMSAIAMKEKCHVSIDIVDNDSDS